jgi:hypothetical protein
MIKESFVLFADFVKAFDTDKQKGRLKEQRTKAEGQTFEVSNVLYVVDDDGAFFCCTQRNYPKAYTFTLRIWSSNACW